MLTEYETGVPVLKPTMEEFHDFRAFVKSIEPIGMKTGIVKIVPPKEWIEKLPKYSSSTVDQIHVESPITQNLVPGNVRGAFQIENVEMKKRHWWVQWCKLCDLLKNQPPVPRGQKQRVLGRFKDELFDYVEYDDSDFTPEVLEHLESRYWKSLALGGSPVYGADLPGSLFKEETTEWNVSALDNLLSVLPDVIPGVNDAYLYCGMWRSTFAWHVEDMNLPSINYIHFGAPKQWYTIPQEYHEEFYQLMSAVWPEEQRKCSEFLRHKTFLIDPAFIRKHKIPVNQVIHRQQEFVITFPYGYHAGFNCGQNIAESVNFAFESWLDYGVKAKNCKCVSHSVTIDAAKMALLIRSSCTGDVPRVIRPPPSAMRSGRCILCPHVYTGEYSSNVSSQGHAHIDCVNLIPEPYFIKDEVYGLEDIDKSRLNLTCSHCEIPFGACFSCAAENCDRVYHGSCADAAGVDISDVTKPFCRFHKTPKPVAGRGLDHFMIIRDNIIQILVNGVHSAGLVLKNYHETDTVRYALLPAAQQKATVDYKHIVAARLPRPINVEVEPPQRKRKAEEGSRLRVVKLRPLEARRRGTPATEILIEEDITPPGSDDEADKKVKLDEDEVSGFVEALQGADSL